MINQVRCDEDETQKSNPPSLGHLCVSLSVCVIVCVRAWLFVYLCVL